MNKHKIKKIISAAVIAVLIVVVCVTGLLISKTRLPDGVPSDVLRAVFFDVGEADCSLFFGDGVAILTDAPEDMTDQARGFMKRAGIKRLDYFIITHYDKDHSGDALKIINAFEVGRVLLPEPVKGKEDVYKSIVAAAGANGCVTVKTGQSFEIKDVKIDILSPNGIGKESNDTCICYKLTYKGASALMCSDITDDEERVILSKYGERIRSDIIKVAHHGSRYSSSEKFIKTVSAKYAVISCGENVYGHPDLDVIKRLKSAGGGIFITQGDGVIIFDLMENSVEPRK